MAVIYITQRPSNLRTADGFRPRFNIEEPARAIIGPSATFEYLTDFTDIKYMTTQELMAKLRSKLLSFSDRDYILMVGHVLVQVLAGCVAAEMNAGKVNIMHWDSQAGAYLVNEIELYPAVEV